MAVLRFTKKKKVSKKSKVKSKARRKITKRKAKTKKRKVAKRKITRVIKKIKPSLKIKKTVRITKPALPQKIVALNEEFVGTATHYFPKVKAAVVNISEGELALGDKIHIKGHTTDFTQVIKSMQIEHVPIDRAKRGDEIGLRVNSRIRIHDSIYKLL